MPRTFEMWSTAEQQVHTFTLVRRPDPTVPPPYEAREIVVLERYDDDGRMVEEYRFSPNMPVDRPQPNPDGTVDFSIEQYVRDVNRRQNHDRNAPEVE